MELIKQCNNFIKKEAFYKRLKAFLEKNLKGTFNLELMGLFGSTKPLIVSGIFDDIKNNNFSVVVVTSNIKEAESFYNDLKSFSYNKVLYFPGWDILPYENVSPFYDIVHMRIEVLYSILSQKSNLIVTTAENIIRNIIPKDIFLQEQITLTVNNQIEYKNLLLNLVELGYVNSPRVEQPGEFSIKGGIIDIFPSSFENPIRIELFDDLIESIRSFDAITQASLKQLSSFQILPQREIILKDEYVENAIKSITERFSSTKDYNHVIEQIRQKIHFTGIEQYLPFFYKPSSLLDYFNENTIFMIDEPERVLKKSQSILSDCDTLYLQSHKTNITKALPDELFQSVESAFDKINKSVNLYLLTHKDESENVIHCPISSPSTYMGDLQLMQEKISEKIENEFHVLLLAPYDAQARRLQHIFKNFNPFIENTELTSSKKKKYVDKLEINPGLQIGFGDIDSGFTLHDSKIQIILERELFGRRRTFSKKLRKINSSPIESFTDLKKSDLVVHINHGVGLFLGIERILANGKERDFILLEYQDKEKLYVPIEQLNLVQKYIGTEGRKALLDKLGGKSWEKAKEKVKKSVAELANELIQIYSVRAKLNGYSFSQDTSWQHEFEAEFEFDETPDQMAAIEDVKKDMESNKPMDRLVCGDVGYGKTEVAIRAAFKAIMNGKQVAVLTPTTILCEQHYNTFKERYKNYPIKIDMLSRFKNYIEQKTIAKRIKAGELDIIIGTHKILAKELEFKNLGLVIIDEEQRFGVRHKERLKSIRKLVDVLTMTATPIPRTLHMALIKLRDMSVIETPPENRLPIETYVMEFNEEIIIKAISDEVNRGGQVFFVYNRVKTIKNFAVFLMSILPRHIRICVAHGQMDEKDLEEIMMAFILKKYDVLICTTIIESGVDIPNVNTILIDRADKLGLAQLYQLRGRVGRSNKQAFCYLFYAPDLALTEIAQKRLAAINEFTDLGSGFKIAMRDMEIRGAGNILGPEQSGNIVSVGFEMYCKLLNEAVVELVSGEKSVDFDTYVDLKYDGYIPDSYINDEKQKIEIYKKIASCTSKDDVTILSNEINDRFGNPPDIVKQLLKISELKAVGRELNIKSIVEKESNIEITFEETSKIDPTNIFLVLKTFKDIAFINPQKNKMLFLKICTYDLEGKVNTISKILKALAITKPHEKTKSKK